jgi:DNA-binding CsgD family transcriptional regulator
MVSSSARLRSWRAELALATGNVEQAAALLDEVEPRLAGLTMHAYVAVVHLLRAEVARRCGEIREGETRAHAALELAAEHEIALLITDALETLALLAGDVGNDAQAARLLGTAEGFRRRTGYRWRPHHRRAALDTLRPRLDPGHLEEGAQLSLDDAVAWARRGRGERRRPEFGWDSLTPSEERVVELVAAGLPNREIAAKLFVSVATVKTHLIHVYGKLDVRTRAELAAAATSRGLELRDRSSGAKPEYLMKGETT